MNVEISFSFEITTGEFAALLAEISRRISQAPIVAYRYTQLLEVIIRGYSKETQKYSVCVDKASFAFMASIIGDLRHRKIERRVEGKGHY